MSKKPAPVDRRRFPRYRVSNGACASNSTKRGQILDISLGGLSFQYPGKKETVNGCRELSILSSECGVVIDKVPLREIRDIPMTDSFITMNRRCVQFDTLSSEQHRLLEQFIRRHTTDKV